MGEQFNLYVVAKIGRQHGIRTRLKNFWHLLIEAGEEFIEDHGTKLSASLAYYTIFSIGPLLLVVITVLGFFYKKTIVTADVFNQVSLIIGRTATMELQSILTNMSKQTNTTLIGVVGILVFIFGATGIFSEIQSSINYIWSVKAKPKRSWVKYIKDRLLSLVLVIGLGFVMLVTIVANLLIDLLSYRLQQSFGDGSTLLVKVYNPALLFAVVTLVFIVIFKVLPDARIHWRDALIGSIFTSVLFIIGKFVIGYYLGLARTINAYGAATSLILVLVWVYYSAIILYYGAEFTEVYAKKYGGGIKVTKNAVHIVKHETDILIARHHTHPDKEGEPPVH